jgi:hypothetical protein
MSKQKQTSEVTAYLVSVQADIARAKAVLADKTASAWERAVARDLLHASEALLAAR